MKQPVTQEQLNAGAQRMRIFPSWSWTLNPKYKSISLESREWMVMTFGRWGMGGATPLFLNEPTHELRRAVEFGTVIPGREHHSTWALDLNHPAARLMAAAPDHALYAAALTAGVARWEQWDAVRGEVCTMSLCCATELDEFGVPVIHAHIRKHLEQALVSAGAVKESR